MLKEIKVGDRVGALLDCKDGKINFLGYGIYKGRSNVPPEAGGLNFGQENPRILLDNGDTVYGCECWWGSEEFVKKQLVDPVYEIVNVRIKDFRKGV